MGMFDDVRVFMKLPGNPGETDFQTKDMDRLLCGYEIGTDEVLRLDGKPVLGVRSLNFYTTLMPKRRGVLVEYSRCGWLEYDATIDPDTGRVESVTLTELRKPRR